MKCDKTVELRQGKVDHQVRSEEWGVMTSGLMRYIEDHWGTMMWWGLVKGIERWRMMNYMKSIWYYVNRDEVWSEMIRASDGNWWGKGIENIEMPIEGSIEGRPLRQKLGVDNYRSWWSNRNPIGDIVKKRRRALEEPRKHWKNRRETTREDWWEKNMGIIWNHPSIGALAGAGERCNKNPISRKRTASIRAGDVQEILSHLGTSPPKNVRTRPSKGWQMMKGWKENWETVGEVFWNRETSLPKVLKPPQTSSFAKWEVSGKLAAGKGRPRETSKFTVERCGTRFHHKGRGKETKVDKGWNTDELRMEQDRFLSKNWRTPFSW